MVDDLLFYIPFNSISVMLGQWVGHNEKMYVVEASLRLKRFPLQAELELGTARSACQGITH